jgi:hypothetical protein
MALDVGGYNDIPDWPKMGPSLVIATALILAIRTAKWPPPRFNEQHADADLQREIDFAAHLARRVFSTLVSRKQSIFPQVKQAWYQPNGDDVPK